MKELFEKLTYGYYIVTALKPGDELKTRDKDYIAAGTANWVSQLSFDPPMFGVAIGLKADLNETIDYSKHFTIHILSEGQKELIQEFAGKSVIEDGKINGIPFEKKDHALVLHNTIGHFTCKVEKSINNGDHTLHIGEVVATHKDNIDAKPICTKEQRPIYTPEKADA